MNYLEAYLARLRAAGMSGMAQSVSKTASRFCGEFFDDFDFCSQTSALLVGNVQSGKTGQMFGIISAAADRDVFVFVILTTDNVLLQQQTLGRVRKDLPEFCVCDEDDTVAFELNNGVRPVVIVLKKNVRTLRRWKKTFLTSRVLEGNPLFILDDEADAASLNTKVNKDDISAINGHIEAIRNDAASSVFLEVTGTPQSIFLQTAESGWKPDYVLAFEPGQGYVGGSAFFGTGQAVPRSIGFTDGDPDPVQTFVVRHLTVSAVSFLRGETVSNALAHVSASTKDHFEVQAAIERILGDLQAGGLAATVQAALAELNAALPCAYDFAEVIHCIRAQVLPGVRVVVKNSKSEDSADFNDGCTFIVGGNALGRGVTIPRLNTVLYTRLAKRPQADTIWQHNRIFGYDRDPELIRVYMSRHLRKLLSDINEQNDSIYAQIRAGISAVKVAFPKHLTATRGSVLDRSALSSLAGGVNRYPDAVRNNTVGEIDRLLSGYGDAGSARCPLSFVRMLLSHIESDDESFSRDDYVEIFDQLEAEKPGAEAVLIVRRGRSVAQGTGALLSPNDWKLGEQTADDTVVTLYRVTGEKGWGGEPLWVPNIRLPGNRVFFTVKK